MNTNSGGQQAQPQGQPSGQQQPARKLPAMYTPEQMSRLPPHFSDADKKKYVAGLGNLWSQMTSNPENSPMHMEAKKKIQEFSATLNNKMIMFRQQAAAQAAAQSQASAQAQSQLQSEGARPASQGQPPQAQPEANTAPTAAAQQPRAQPSQPAQVPQHVIDHLNSFPFTLPLHIQKDTPEAQRWLLESRSRMTRALMQMEYATTNTKRYESMVQHRNNSGTPMSAEDMQKMETEKEKLTKSHAEAKRYVDDFRKSQEQIAASIQGQQGGQQGNVAPTRPTLNPQQPNPAQQNTQAVTAAFEAARNMQGANRVGNPNGLGQQAGSQAQTSSSFPNMPQHAGITNVKQEGSSQQPHGINTAIPNHVSQMNRPMGNNSPQSANPQSATSMNGGGGPPRALTHQAALTQAARTYSSGQTTGTPNVMGHSHAHPNISRNGSENNITSTKMPIPKNLPERAQQPATPVNMPSSRPTLSGGPSMSNQAMQQPAVQARPSYEFGEDGDRVLSKKKLDELVRQVTGGGDGSGDGDLSLTPEVEESILNVADDFVDQVLYSACQLARVRGSEVLEIRDIQLVLERNYNIRIPGYASDEVRTVRKFQPAPGWVAKMSAVQAAKVTNNNKNDA